MEKTIFSLLLFISTSIIAQDSYFKNYIIPQNADYGYRMKDKTFSSCKLKKTADSLDGDVVKKASNLKKIQKIQYRSLKITDSAEYKAKQTIDKKYPNPQKEIIIKYETKLGGRSISIYDTTLVKDYLDGLTVEVPKGVNYSHKLKGYVKFEGDKVYVNPFLLKKSNGEYIDLGVHYYELDNRQSMRLTYQEFNVSAMTIPIKYRFPNSKKSIPETTTTEASGYVVFSYGIGRSYFFHRKEVGNKVNSYKVSLGATIGLSSVVLNSINTSADRNPVGEDIEYNRGIISGGVGIFFYANKFNIGFLYGQDYGIGTYTKRWNYQGEPWLGIGIGYDIFK